MRTAPSFRTFPQRRIGEVAVGLLVLAVVAAGCASTDPARVADIEERTARLESRVAGLEEGAVSAADAGAAPAGAPPTVAESAIKNRFAAMLDSIDLAEDVAERGDARVEVSELRFDPSIDLVRAVVRPIDGGEADAAWHSAKALAPLWVDLGEYGPALELEVGTVRCVCSAALMKALADDTTERAAWEAACGR